jgi:hypothetical protein
MLLLLSFLATLKELLCCLPSLPPRESTIMPWQIHLITFYGNFPPVFIARRQIRAHINITPAEPIKQAGGK